MRYLFLLAAILPFFLACNKDKFTTAPQIKFKSIKPEDVPPGINLFTKDLAPKLTIHISDAEGDIGMNPNKDTARIFVKNLLSNRVDSFDIPELPGVPTKNFEADIVINLYNTLYCRPVGPPKPRIDTTYYDVYVKDFAKNKSNVIRTDKPVYMHCL